MPGATATGELAGDTEPEGHEITKPHDAGEWLAGFNAEVRAGRNDVVNAVRASVGAGPILDAILAGIQERLGT